MNPATDKLPLSLVLIARNEAANLPRCLDSVAPWCSEIVVVVNDCTDDTVDIARRCGARIYEHAWQGHRDQKNIALNYATQPWILCVDADEEVTSTLAASIREFIQRDDPHFAGAYFARQVFFLGKWIRHGDWYPDWSLRLLRRGRGKWGGSPEHDKMELDGPAAKIAGDLNHYTCPGLHEHLQKIGYFGDIFLKCQLDRGAHWSAANAISRSLWRFIRAYIFRLGFLDGFRGFYIAYFTSYATFYRHTLLWEYEQKQRMAGKPSASDLMRLSLIVSTYNNPAPLDLIISRLATDASARLHELIIADDGSGEATRAVVEKWKKAAPFAVKHAWHEDKGFRKTRILNAALAMTTGDYVVFLDGDCLPASRFVADHGALAERGTFVQGRRAFVREEKVPDLLAGKTTLLRLMLSGQVHGLLKGIRWPVPIVRRNQGQRGLIGCNLGIWRDDLVAVNGFDEAYEGWGIGEDSDLGSRLYHLGRQRKFVYGRALVFHLDHPQLNKAHVPQSLQRLQETLAAKKIRCEMGLSQHQPAMP